MILWLMCPQGIMADTHRKHPQKGQILYRYRLLLADKQGSHFSIDRPEEFLSAKALLRRARYGLSVDEYDLPVSEEYRAKLQALGLRIHVVSKWNNTVVVETNDTALLSDIRALPFVKAYRKVWTGCDTISASDNPVRYDDLAIARDTLTDFYGYGQHQIEMLSAQRLHSAGFMGEGMTIAVLDGGFLNADVIPWLQTARILGTYNFVNRRRSVYAGASHGTSVLSCMATNVPQFFVGTAPSADYYLFQTEDGTSEQLVEEDNYVAALERADSLGVDVVTASLGYHYFDDPEMNHVYSEQDGLTAVNSFAASLAASRGMLVLNSAGNEGNDTWKKIGFPADAIDILTVGAVRADSVNTVFSSLGYTADGRVKPDVMAQGEATALLRSTGRMAKGNGTSYSTPVMCGAVTCLWQAHRDKSPQEIIKAVRASGHNVASPNEVYGYGIPDLWRAHKLLSENQP